MCNVSGVSKLCWLSAQWRQEKISTLKYYYHRLGLVSVFLCGVRTIDPHGFFGIMGHGLINSFIMDNVTCFIVAAGVKLAVFVV